MIGIRNYRDLAAWQKSMDLVVEIYGLTKCFPREEQWGLTSQIRRAAVSIAANIAEGHGRMHRADYLRFLSIARGSHREVETHLQIAVRLQYLDRQAARPAWILLQDVGRLLHGLIKSLSPEQVSEESATYTLDDEILIPDPDPDSNP